MAKSIVLKNAKIKLAAMNGASDFIVGVFGDLGRHIRTAAGVAGLPMGFAASVCMIAEVEEQLRAGEQQASDCAAVWIGSQA
jgi:hypothetical protein